MSLKRRKFTSLACSSLLTFAMPASSAQGHGDAGDYALQLIVPNPPGGTVDAVARLIGRLIQESAGLKMLVNNVAGGTHLVAANVLLNATRPNDVLLYATTNLLSYVPLLAPETLKFVPEEELIPIAIVGVVHQLLVVHKDFNITALLDHRSEQADRKIVVTMGSLGASSATYFQSKKLAQLLNLDMTIVPYRGMADLSMALLSGHVQMGFVDEFAAQQLLISGKVQLVATMSTSPSMLFPKLPLWHQLGKSLVPFDMDRPFTVFSGRRMSSQRRTQLTDLLKALDRMPSFHKSMRELGVQPTLIAGNEARKHLREIVAQERRMIEDFNLLKLSNNPR